MAQRDDGTRQRILDAAGAVFAEHGFERATIRDIIARAEVNLAAVNYHFGDKERLYRATVRHAHEIAVSQVPLPEWEVGTPADVRLRGFIRTMLQRMLMVQKLPWQARLMMREFVHPTGASKEVVEEYIRPHNERLMEILRELLPPETAPHRVQQLAFSIVGQCLFYKLSDPIVSVLVPEQEVRSHYQLPQLAEHIAEVMLAALGFRPLFSDDLNPVSSGCSESAT